MHDRGESEAERIVQCCIVAGAVLVMTCLAMAAAIWPDSWAMKVDAWIVEVGIAAMVALLGIFACSYLIERGARCCRREVGDEALLTKEDEER